MTRRRLAVAAAVVAVAVLVIKSLPSGDGLGHSQPRGPAQPIAQPPHEVPLTAAARRGINRTLDAFVPLAVRRQGPRQAFALTTSSFHGTARPSDWADGSLPVLAYPAAGHSWHGWKLDFAYPRQVELELELHPRDHTKVGLVAFAVGLEKHGHRWLIDTFTPVASFQATGDPANIQAEPDFSPKAKGSPAFSSRLSGTWILLPAALFGGPLVAALVIAAVLLVRSRRRRPAAAEPLDDYYQRMGGR